MTELERIQRNRDNLVKIDEHPDTGNVRSKIEQTLLTLSVYMPAIIHKDVFRTEAEQLKKYYDGVSQVKYGFHCFTRAGSPASLAADIVSSDYNYFDDKQFVLTDTDEIFWLLLGSIAVENGLSWGGFFGLEKGEVGILKRNLRNPAYGIFIFQFRVSNL